jgi:hypothetical protein
METGPEESQGGVPAGQPDPSEPPAERAASGTPVQSDAGGELAIMERALATGNFEARGHPLSSSFYRWMANDQAQADAYKACRNRGRLKCRFSWSACALQVHKILTFVRHCIYHDT